MVLSGEFGANSTLPRWEDQILCWPLWTKKKKLKNLSALALDLYERECREHLAVLIVNGNLPDAIVSFGLHRDLGVGEIAPDGEADGSQRVRRPVVLREIAPHATLFRLSVGNKMRIGTRAGASRQPCALGPAFLNEWRPVILVTSSVRRLTSVMGNLGRLDLAS